MATEAAIILKAESLVEATKLAGLSGKTFTVGKAPVMFDTMGKWLVLDPVGGAAGQGSVAVKLAGTKEAFTAQQLAGLTGQKVTVGKVAAVTGQTGKWIVLNPVTGGAAKGALVKGAAATTATKSITTLGKSTAGISAAKGAAAGGTIWKGTGLSLGLGLGLGAWGPAILLGLIGAGIYGYYSEKSKPAEEAV